MNIRIPSEDAHASDFVFRTADRMRIDGCVNALTQEGMSLALSCEQEALLDHYLTMMLAQLRQDAPDHRIEVYFPTNTDALLGRFNDVLAAQSLQQATQPASRSGPAHIWIVHDAHRLPESEIQLLARLIQNFPGAQIRAILLKSGAQATEWPLSAFGRRLLRWDVEVPSLAQAQAAMALAQHEGRSGPIVQLLKRMEHPACADALEPDAQPDTEPALPPRFSRVLSGLKQQVHLFHQRGQTALQFQQGAPFLRTQLRPRWGLSLGLLGALSLSTLLMLWLQPEAFGIATSQKVAKPSPVTSARPSAPTDTPPLSPASNAPKAQDTAEVVAPMVSAATPAMPSTDSPQDTLRAQTWIKGMDPQSFLLQYGTANTYSKALDIQRRLPAQQASAIVAAYKPGEKLAQFVVVAGPYALVNDAYIAARQPNMPNGTWVRSTRNLQSQLVTTSAAQETTR